MRRLREVDKAIAADWETSKSVLKAAAKISEIVSKGDLPASGDFDACWNNVAFKDAVVSSQDGQCYWCTARPADGNCDGTIDHLRPKAGVDRTLVAEGKEEGVRVSGRQFGGHHSCGYWWLAYKATNLAFACDACNKKWKRNYWPIGSPSGAAPIQSGSEESLVLDPRDSGFRAFEHFAGTPLGVLVPRTDKAKATMKLVGLDRQSLIEKRRRALASVEVVLPEVIRLSASGEDHAEAPALEVLMAHCSWTSPHALVCRALVHSRVGSPAWEWLRRRWKDAFDDNPVTDSWVG